MNRALDPAYRFSGLGRPLDPSYPTNRAVLVVTALLLAAGTLWSRLVGLTWLDASVAGLSVALLAFVAWALTRELDPDGETAAFVAVAAAVLAWLVWPPQSILAPAALVLAARIVNRTTGKAAEPVDSVFVVVGFVAAGWLVHWTLACLGAAALGLDATLPRPHGQRKRSYHLVAGAFVLGATAPVWTRGLSGLEAPPYALAVLAGAGLAGVAVLVGPPPRSVGDVDRELLEPLRVRAATVLTVTVLALATLDAGQPASELATAWSCAAVAAVAALRRRLAESAT